MKRSLLALGLLLTIVLTALPVAAAPPKPVPAWKKGAPITVPNVKYTLGHAPRKLFRSVALSQPKQAIVDDAGGAVILIYKIRESDFCETCSDSTETDLLTIGAATTYGAQRAMFLNPKVQTSTVTMQAAYIDKFGKTTVEDVLTSTLTRATVDGNVVWGGLGDVVEGDNKAIYCISDSRFVRASIFLALDDPGCLDGLQLVP